SGDLPARRNVFGDAIAGEGGVGPDIISPIWKSTAKNDPTIKALVDSGIGISMPQRKEMSPGEYDAYTERTGHILKPNLDALVASPEWKLMTNDERDKAVSDEARAARKAAKEGGWSPPASDSMVATLPPGFVIDQ
ncbi:MAG: hypothetical protein OSB00_08630, partial [Sphingomonas bacterium]|nr:hypothetical protein [Sphingomonas bacterium]